MRYNRKINSLLIAVVMMTMVMSCGRYADDDDVLATAYGHRLMVSDVEGVVPEGVTGGDSIEIMRNYIDQWVDRMVIIYRAERNVRQDFTKQLEQYRSNLVVYAYEQHLVEQNVDTMVSRREIEDYYTSHPDDFVLVSPIVKVVYVKLRNGAKATTQRRIVSTMQSSSLSDEDIVRLRQTESPDILKLSLDYDQWVTLSTLTGVVPQAAINDPLYLRRHKSTELTDSVGTTYTHIVDYKLSNELSPLEIEVDKIKNIIINHRKMVFLQRMRQDLRREAEEDGKVMIAEQFR